MRFSFQAKIYKVGINPCVKVPFRITETMTPLKGYIPVKGKIKRHPFKQTLVPVKNAEYRLYVNTAMLKGSDAKVGDTLKFSIEQDFEPRTVSTFPMPKTFKKALVDNNLMNEFEKLTPTRQKEILKYLNYLKTEESLIRNVDKVITPQKEKQTISNTLKKNEDTKEVF